MSLNPTASSLIQTPSFFSYGNLQDVLRIGQVPYTQPQNIEACVEYAPTLLLHRWLEDPFLGEIIHQDGQDYIFGRGAIDDKHSVVDFLYFFSFSSSYFFPCNKNTAYITYDQLEAKKTYMFSVLYSIRASLQVGILQALEVILSDGGQPKRTLYVAFGHDEEVGLAKKIQFQPKSGCTCLFTGKRTRWCWACCCRSGEDVTAKRRTA